MKRPAFDQHRNLGSLWNAFTEAHAGVTPHSVSIAELLIWSFARSQQEHEASALTRVHLFGRGVERGEA